MRSGVDPAVWRGQRVLRMGLAFLWLIAGVLQFQPDMFTPDFYANYPDRVMESFLQGLADSQPGWLQHLILFGRWLWASAPFAWNIIAASLQCVIGLVLGLIRNRTIVRIALWISVGWGVIVWVFGEAFGSLFSDEVGYLAGSPGPVCLYVVAALLLLAPISWWQLGHVERVIRCGLGVLWTLFAVLQALKPGIWTNSNVMSVFANAGSLSQPWFFGEPIASYALWLANHPIAGNSVLVICLGLLGLGFLLRGWTPSLSLFCVLWLTWTWWFIEDFGGLFSGLATDLNLAPILFVFFTTGYVMRSVAKEARSSCLFPVQGHL